MSRKEIFLLNMRHKQNLIINALLEKYATDGIENVEELSVLKLEPLKQFGSPSQIIQLFGGKSQYLSALGELKSELYRVA